MDKYEDFKIIPYKDHFIIINTKGTREQHTHIKRWDTCKMLIKLVCKKRVPHSNYLKTSAKRISRNQKYIEKIEKG